MARGEKCDAVRQQSTARSERAGLCSSGAPPGRDDSLDEHARGLVAHGELDRPALFRTINGALAQLRPAAGIQHQQQRRPISRFRPRPSEY